MLCCASPSAALELKQGLAATVQVQVVKEKKKHQVCACEHTRAQTHAPETTVGETGPPEH